MSPPVHLESYNPAWVGRFASERDVLREALSAWIVGGIEHVGSTAVPGLLAKPIVDIMVGVASLRESEPAIQVLEGHDYCYFPYKVDVMHWFCKPSPEVRTHHLHLVPFQSRLWRERLAFRDALRANPELALEYGLLKSELARAHEFDREAYTEAKTPFIMRVLTGMKTGCEIGAT